MEGVVEFDRVGYREASQSGKCWETLLQDAVDLWPPVEATRVVPAVQHLSLEVDDIVVALDHVSGLKFRVATFVDDAHGEGVMASDAAMLGHVAKACDVRGADVGCECMSMMVCMAR